MLLLGRSPNLVLGALTAVFNIIVAIHLGGFNPDVSQIAVVNVGLGAIVALIANNDTVQIAAGRASAARKNGS